jgi:hypothetical protein
MCRRRARSSGGGILDFRLAQDAFSEMRPQLILGSEVHGSPEEGSHFALDACQAEVPDPNAGLELHQQVEVAVPRVLAAKGGSEERELPDAVPAAQLGQVLVVWPRR